MLPVSHAAASGIVSAVFAYFTGSLWGTVLCFFSGILIDLDHLIDYWIEKKKILIDYQELVRYCGRERQGRLYLIFHSVEFWLLFWIILGYYQWNTIWLGLAVGVTAHLIIDQLANPTTPWALFLFYRWKHKFSKVAIFRADYFREMT